MLAVLSVCVSYWIGIKYKKSFFSLFWNTGLWSCIQIFFAMYRRFLISDPYKNELLHVLCSYNQFILALKTRHFWWKYCHVLCISYLTVRIWKAMSFHAFLLSFNYVQTKINEPVLCMWTKSAVLGYFCTYTSQILTEVRKLLYYKLISFWRRCLRKLGDCSLRVSVSL